MNGKWRQVIDTDKSSHPKIKNLVEAIDGRRQISRAYGEFKKIYPGPTINYKDTVFGDS